MLGVAVAVMVVVVGAGGLEIGYRNRGGAESAETKLTTESTEGTETERRRYGCWVCVLLRFLTCGGW